MSEPIVVVNPPAPAPVLVVDVEPPAVVIVTAPGSVPGPRGPEGPTGEPGMPGEPGAPGITGAHWAVEAVSSWALPYREVGFNAPPSVLLIDADGFAAEIGVEYTNVDVAGVRPGLVIEFPTPFTGYIILS